jgi:hypothetical protein
MVKVCSLPDCGKQFDSTQPLAQYCCPKHRSVAAGRRFRSSVNREEACALDSCGKSFTTVDYRQKYCSRSCAAINNNRVRGDNRLCWCGARLQYWQKVGCSRSHAASKRGDLYIERWLRGEEAGSDVTGILKHRCRVFLLERANYRCVSPDCAVPGGWSVPNPITGKPILTVDHIDGNWRNNVVDNLIVLCYSCHTLTPTFGSLNAGNGQGTRGSGGRRSKAV